MAFFIFIVGIILGCGSVFYYLKKIKQEKEAVMNSENFEPFDLKFVDIQGGLNSSVKFDGMTDVETHSILGVLKDQFSQSVDKFKLFSLVTLDRVTRALLIDGGGDEDYIYAQLAIETSVGEIDVFNSIHNNPDGSLFQPEMNFQKDEESKSFTFVSSTSSSNRCVPLTSRYYFGIYEEKEERQVYAILLLDKKTDSLSLYVGYAVPKSLVQFS